MLVVDDFDSFRMTVSRMLLEFGCARVDTAVNGQEALRLCEDTAYDLILCDFNLGRGRNGLQVLEEMRHKSLLRKSTLFLLVSAESSREIVLAASDYEPDGYLTKPLNGKALRQRLDRALHQRNAMKPIYRAIDEDHIDAAIVLCLQHIDDGSRYSILCQKLLGKLYLQTGKLELAEQVYRQVLEVRDMDWAQVGMAKVKRAGGDTATAVGWLEKIVEQHPLCLQAYDELADCHQALGNNDQRQAVLERAVEVSPVALVRQQTLAQVATENNDKIAAAKTYRKVVKLSDNSIHDNVENYLAFTRAAAAVFTEDEAVGREMLRDAVAVIDKVEKKFGKDDGRRRQLQLIECQLQVHQGNAKRANELFLEANTQMDDLGLQDIDTELDRVMAMQALGQPDKAQLKLKDLVAAFAEDQAALQKIDRLLEEPVSEENRRQVAKINKEGIHLYEEKSYLAAIECFQRAKRMFPMHTGVQLNLVQALAGQMRSGDPNPEWMDLALHCLKSVEAMLTATHPQFQRYRQLLQMVRQVEMERKQQGLKS
ncbi:response regulator [Simiduia sp. 21SJ11W-1]|uniref:tetratricopeptide repeat-containing response regulator n=1 Tax=Simiduia sp. 21SJ11W-1 TaxID=2909669 RepID=UPI00209DF73C|nr:tetratricopeptide repeat-containing response regulator [Simiduia sp. 21SJ11W-1]UTA46513.1 response regulator [Simiduia sp. 21SJ11W-1]